MRPFLAVAPLALLAACQGQQAAPAVSDAWVRLPSLAGRPGAAYFTLTGGNADATLVLVSSPAAARAELHESTQAGGTMTMQPIERVAVPAGGEVRFEPGGRHVMLFGLDPALKPGGEAALILLFADGRRIETTARLVGAGDPAPQP